MPIVMVRGKVDRTNGDSLIHIVDLRKYQNGQDTRKESSKDRQEGRFQVQEES